MLTLAKTPPLAAVEEDTADLVVRLIALDSDAWQLLFDRHFGQLYSFAFVRTGDACLAEEIAIDTFAAAAKGIGSYRPTGAPIGAWLYAITRNLTADELSRRTRRPAIPLGDIEIESTNAFTGFEDRSDILDAISWLGPDQQEVLLLRFFCDCSVAETAQAMGKSENAVKVQQFRALAALRSQLWDRNGGVKDDLRRSLG